MSPGGDRHDGRAILVVWILLYGLSSPLPLLIEPSNTQTISSSPFPPSQFVTDERECSSPPESAGHECAFPLPGDSISYFLVLSYAFLAYAFHPNLPALFAKVVGSKTSIRMFQEDTSMLARWMLWTHALPLVYCIVLAAAAGEIEVWRAAVLTCGDMAIAVLAIGVWVGWS